MAYAATPAAPKPRPSTVTLAVWLLYLYAALQLLAAGLALATIGQLRDAYRKAFQGSSISADDAATIAVVTVVVTLVVGLLFAAGFVVLAIFNGKGKNPARIVTWVLGGIAVCCGGLGLITSVAGSSMNFGSGGANGPSQAEVTRVLKETMPGWYYPTLTSLGVIELLTIIAVVALLATPASNRFFRKQPAPVWQPPVPPPPASY